MYHKPEKSVSFIFASPPPPINDDTPLFDDDGKKQGKIGAALAGGSTGQRVVNAIWAARYYY